MSAVRVVSSTCASGMIATLEIELVSGDTKSVDMVGERQVLGANLEATRTETCEEYPRAVIRLPEFDRSSGQQPALLLLNFY